MNLSDKSMEVIYMNQNEPVFNIYIANLGKYVEGDLCGEWVGLPTDKKTIREMLKRIEIDGKQYEEIAIHDYECEISNMCDSFGEYEHIDELNYLASLIDDLDVHERKQFEAIVESGILSCDIADLVNLTQSLDCFFFLPGINDHYDLGHYYIHEVNCYDLDKTMGSLSSYFDYERYGRDIDIESTGMFVGNGYIEQNDSIDDSYSGLDDVPDEYKVMSRPKVKDMREVR